jgi:hypothetical protein
MFSKKQPQLISPANKPSTNKTSGTMVLPGNPFLKAGVKNSVQTTSLGNGALKVTTTGSDFVDDFGKITNYKAPRTFEEISRTVSVQWAQNPMLAVCMIFYIRMITRVVSLFDGSKTSETQRGQGLKHEGIFRMIWVAINAPDTFWKNIGLFISVGSWKDVITMLSYDLQYNGWNERKLDWDKFGKLILAGLENPNQSQLIKKYLPQIKSNSQCKTLEAQADNLIGKWICNLLFGNKGEESGHTYKKYRQLKTSGTAHQWQQLISQGKHSLIDFNTVHGRALSKLVSSKYLANQGLTEKYSKWIEAKPVAKYTGYVYELFIPLGTATIQTYSHLQKYQVDTINKQFLNLVEVAKNGMNKADSGFIGVLDTSGSMTSLVPGTKVSAYSVGKSLTLFMSYLLEGRFNSCYLEFSTETIMKQWKGDSPVTQLCADNSSIVEDTNFLSVADHFGKILKEGVPEAEFPRGIVCFSDGCFNRAGRNKSNFRALKDRLKQFGFSSDYVDNFKVILWDIPNNYYGKAQTAFEDFADTPNLFHISGLDASALAFITGTKSMNSIPKNSDELLQAALGQEIMKLIEL